MGEKLEIRVHGTPEQPTLVYLPGLHGDWTLIGAFRTAVRGRLRFVEITYPRTLTWTLEEYAAGVESGLAEQGITSGWLLAESFGSQVVWPLLARGRFQANGLILAGGFGRHPVGWAVRLAEKFCGGVSLTLLTRLLFGYAKIARWRFRNSPECFNLQEFISRRTELDRQAAKHRLRLVAENNPCAAARGLRLPVYALTGFFDPIVPWLWARRWLRKNCPALREYRVIWRADHNVLGTGTQAAAGQVLAWIQEAL